MCGSDSIAITGANGFIGRHLTRVLSSMGHKVECISRSQFDLAAGVIFNRIDSLFDAHLIRPVFERCSCVVHLAGLVHSQDKSVSAEYDLLNHQATSFLAKLAQSSGVRQFIFMSSLHSICASSNSAVTVTTQPKPDSAYGISKLLAEQALSQIAQTGMKWTIVLPALVYGSGNVANMDKLIRLVRKEIPLPLSMIKNRRSFVYVGNLIDLLLCVIKLPEQAHAQRLLVSDGQDLSTPQLIKLIAKFSGSRCKLWPLPTQVLLGLGTLSDLLRTLGLRTGSISRQNIERLVSSLYVNISHTRSVLNWTPPISVEEGLQKTILEYEN